MKARIYNKYNLVLKRYVSASNGRINTLHFVLLPFVAEESTAIILRRIYLDKHPARVIIGGIEGDVVLMAPGDSVSSFLSIFTMYVRLPRRCGP